MSIRHAMVPAAPGRIQALTIRADRRAVAAFVLVSVGIAVPALAGWERVPLPGEAEGDLRVEKLTGTADGVLYAYARSAEMWSYEAHLFRREEPGGTWEALHPNLPDDVYECEGMEANGRTPGLLFQCGAVASDSVYYTVRRSTDGGLTWGAHYPRPLGLPEREYSMALASDHGSGRTVYASAYMNGLYRSDDGGVTFALVNPAIRYPVPVAVHPANDLHLFLTGAWPEVVSVSFDGGVTTSPRDAGLPRRDGVVPQILLDSDDPDHLEVVCWDGEVYETRDGGLSWSLRFRPQHPATSTRAAWDPATGYVFVLIDGSRIESDHPLYEADGLPGNFLWSVWYSPSDATLFAAADGRYTGGALWSQSLGLPVEPRVADPVGVVEGLRGSPNPFRSGTVLDFTLPPSGGAVSLVVYDVAGRSVRALEPGRGVGLHRVAWDGRSDLGRLVPAGVYFAHLDSPSGTRILKLVRLP